MLRGHRQAMRVREIDGQAAWTHGGDSWLDLLRAWEPVSLFRRPLEVRRHSLGASPEVDHPYQLRELLQASYTLSCKYGMHAL